MAWTKNGTPDTIISGGDVLEITDLTALKFNFIMCHGLQAGDLNPEIKLDAVTTQSYARRNSRNGGGDTEFINQTLMMNPIRSSANADFFAIGHFINIDGEEKFGMVWSVQPDAGLGSVNPPGRYEGVGKSIQTAQFTGIDFDNIGTGNYANNSNLSALGTD